MKKGRSSSDGAKPSQKPSRLGKKFQIDLLVFDFDGVLTDNTVYVADDGSEAVRCNRSDGLGFDMFHAATLPVFILSTERNGVVARRAEKLRVPCLHGVGDKASALREHCRKNHIPLERVAYVGNDLNDLAVMKIVGIRWCPSDAHPAIRRLADRVLRARGGAGVAREIAEELLHLHC